MHRPRVSIGLPVYNGQRYLEAALRSLVSQTYGDFELIISDNASTDRTAEICQDHARSDPRVRYSRNETNVGANPNFNRVLDLARGEYFRWAAYDDLCQSGYLARCVEALDADPGAVLAHTQTQVIDESGRPIDTSAAALAMLGLQAGDVDDPPRDLAASSPARRFTEILLHTKWCFEIFGLMRTAILRETGGHGSFYGSDKAILAYMALQGRFLEVPEKLFLRRNHAQQSSGLKSARQREAWSGVVRPGKYMASQKGCLAGYCRAIRHSALPLTTRLTCYTVVARYLMQVHKWPRTLGLERHRPAEVPAPLPGTPTVR